MATKAHPTNKQHTAQASGEKRKAQTSAETTDYEAHGAAAAGSGGTAQTRERVKESLEGVREQVADRSALKAELAQLRENLKAEIKAELAQMRGTTSEAMESAQKRVERTSLSMAESVRQNPLPIAMTSIGLAWLFSSARHDERQEAGGGNGHTAKEGAEELAGEARASLRRTGAEVRQRASDIARQAGSTIDEARHAATERVGSAARGMRERGDRLSSGLAERFEENPWWTGAAALAAGTLLAMALPGTRRENSILGGARDDLVHGVQALAHGALDKVQSAAGRVEQTAAQLAGKRGSEE